MLTKKQIKKEVFKLLRKYNLSKVVFNNMFDYVSKSSDRKGFSYGIFRKLGSAYIANPKISKKALFDILITYVIESGFEESLFDELTAFPGQRINENLYPLVAEWLDVLRKDGDYALEADMPDYDEDEEWE